MAVPETKGIIGQLGRESWEVLKGHLQLHSCHILSWLLVTEAGVSE